MLFFFFFFIIKIFCSFTIGTALKGKNLLLYPFRVAPILEVILGIIFLGVRQNNSVLTTPLKRTAKAIIRLHKMQTDLTLRCLHKA